MAKDEKKETGLAIPEDCEHGDLRRQILALRDKSESSAWELGVVLEEAYSNDRYRSWGFDSWTEYVEQELDINLRKAQYLVKLQKWFATMTPAIQKWIMDLGWTKARMLMHVVDKTNAAEWKNRVTGKTVAEIEEMLKANRDSVSSEGGGSDDSSEKARRRSFALFPDQDEIVTKALEKASEIAESEKEGHLLSLICMDYIANATDIFTRDDFLKGIERNLGLKILAMVPTGKEGEQDDIVYGYDYLHREDADEAGEA